MARKNTVRYQLASGQSLSSSFHTNPTMIEHLDNCSYQINITTTNSIGTFSVQGSNDYDQSAPGQQTHVGTWIDLTLGGGTPFVNAANDTVIIDLNQLPFNAVRLAYTAGTAGTGTVDIWVVCKQLGG